MGVVTSTFAKPQGIVHVQTTTQLTVLSLFPTLNPLELPSPRRQPFLVGLSLRTLLWECSKVFS